MNIVVEVIIFSSDFDFCLLLFEYYESYRGVPEVTIKYMYICIFQNECFPDKCFISATESDLPYGNGIDTVFLLDVSESMRGEGLKQMQAVCHSIIDGKYISILKDIYSERY